MVEDVKKEEVKKEVKQEVKQQEKKNPETPKEEVNKGFDYSDIFIGENDTFDVGVSYYKDKEGILKVKHIDEDFDTKMDCKNFKVTFKYPNQGDVATISAHASTLKINLEELDVRDFLNLEFSRMTCLIRKWTMTTEISQRSIMQLNPKIVKGILFGIREKIGMDGIL